VKENVLNLKIILTTLKKHNVRFVLIGGQAGVAQGSAYMTRDVDICYARQLKD
jgi:predicted nucleotidyltransferase